MLKKLFVVTVLLIIGCCVGLGVLFIQNAELETPLTSGQIAVGLVVVGFVPTALYFAAFRLLRFIWDKIYAVTAEQQRYLAFGAILFRQNAESCRTLKLGMISKRKAKALLRDWWDIRNRDGALQTVQRLAAADIHTDFADDVYHNLIQKGRFDSLTPADIQHINGENARQIERINAALRNYKTAQKLLIKLGYTESELSEIKSMAAWDLGRTGFIARYGANTGYLQKDEAWQYMQTAAENAVKVYSGWREYLAAYILGRAVGYGNVPTEYYNLFKYLLDNPKSPFNEVQFR